MILFSRPRTSASRSTCRRGGCTNAVGGGRLLCAVHATLGQVVGLYRAHPIFRVAIDLALCRPKCRIEGRA